MSEAVSGRPFGQPALVGCADRARSGLAASRVDQAQGLNNRERLILGALTRAANSGTTCPGNRELADIIGSASVSSPVNAMHILEARGLITVERFGTARRVTICGTGKSTAAVPGKPHWSARGVVKSAPRDRQAERIAFVQSLREENLPAAVNRDPCPRCGTRRDIGCAHSADRIAMGFSL